MARPRKTLEQLKLSGTYQQNKARYADRVPSAVPTAANPATEGLGEPPSHLKAAENTCWNEIAGMGILTFGDRLALEVVSKLLSKSRKEELKPTQLLSLSKQIEKLTSKGQNVAVEPAPEPEPEIELTPWEQFFADDDEDTRRTGLIRAEMTRRKEAGPLDGQTEKEFEYSFRWSDVQKDLTEEHSWHRLYAD